MLSERYSQIENLSYNLMSNLIAQMPHPRHIGKLEIRFTPFMLLLLLFNQVYCPYRALELCQILLHGLEASSYYTIFCPYEFLRRHPQ